MPRAFGHYASTASSVEPQEPSGLNTVAQTKEIQMSKLGQRFLVVYSFVLTGMLAVTVFTAPAPKKTSFDEIDVHRINVLEPDGTLRMVISNHARFPGIIVHGKEKPFERP